MKNILILISMLFVAGLSQAQTTNTENFIQTRIYLEPVTTPSSTAKQIETVQYFDGLGRPKQVVNVKASPLGKDVVSHIEYDSFGRQVKDYLPVPQGGTMNGAIVPTPLANATQADIYGSEKIYAEKILENSPLDRIQQQIQVGNDWTNKPVKFDYDANIASDYVRKYETTTTWVEGRTQTAVQLLQYFQPSKLYKNTITDEDGNKTIEFKNGQGQTLLVRKVLSATENTDTYYVYNEYNQLAFVIPPLASAPSVEPSTVENLYYQYRYDGRNRLVEKKLPGKGWEYMVYDKQDRLVLTQDSNLRDQGKWLFTKYDQFSRPIYTGILDSPPGRIQQVVAVESMGSNNEVRLSSSWNNSNMDIFYTTGSAYPAGNFKLLSVNYYDIYQEYSFNPVFPTDILGQPTLTDNSSGPGMSTKSLPVMSFVKNIEDDNWTKNYIWYDQKGRTIGSYSINHLGGYTRTESLLDFSGTSLQAVTKHKRLESDPERIVTENFTYDHQNRLKTHTHQVDQNPGEYLAQNEYNELLQLKTKKVGGATLGSGLQTVDYKYNIRGWMTQINDPGDLSGDDLFGYKINYNHREGLEMPNSDFTNLTVKPKYNGNIAEVSWKTQTEDNEPLKRYGYVYDNLNRLSAGFYQKAGYETSKEYFEKMEYDPNGNITRLQRSQGLIPGGSTTALAIDNLKYDYIGNRLTKVTEEQIGNSNGYPYLVNHNTIEYDNNTVNGNGNMTKHLDKGITSIQYNFLNLPKQITQNSELTNFTYRSDGVKLKKVFGNLETNYLDGFQYKSSFSYESWNGTGTYIPDPNEIPVIKLRIIPTSEGYYDALIGQYIYNFSDHLGNVRLSYSDSNNDGVVQPRYYAITECKPKKGCYDVWKPGEIVEVNNYYPFGLVHNYNATTQNAYQYKYQSQELQETGFYSFKWRNYMPDVGRFFNVDPLTEIYNTWSPYTFSGNRVIDSRELEGLEPLSIHATMDDAAKNFGTYYNGTSISVNQEYGSTIYSVTTSTGGTGYSYSVANVGTTGASVSVSPAPVGSTSTGDIHTHAAYDPMYANNVFSGIPATGSNTTSTTGDIGDNNSTGLTGYVATPNGSLQKYDPSSGIISTISTNLPSDVNDPARLNTINPAPMLPPPPPPPTIPPPPVTTP